MGYVVGINATFINVAFLNLMSIIAQRAGRVVVRIGGNSQETATLVDSLSDGKAIEKDKADSINPVSHASSCFIRNGKLTGRLRHKRRPFYSLPKFYICSQTSPLCYISSGI